MFDLNKKTEYGLELMLVLVKNYQQGPTALTKIAKDEKLPLKYLEQIANALKNHGLVEAKEGKNGGYFLTKNPQSISLVEIIEAIEGPSQSNCICCAKASTCSQKDLWAEVNASVKKTIRQKSLADLAR